MAGDRNPSRAGRTVSAYCPGDAAAVNFGQSAAPADPAVAGSTGLRWIPPGSFEERNAVWWLPGNNKRYPPRMPIVDSPMIWAGVGDGGKMCLPVSPGG